MINKKIKIFLIFLLWLGALFYISEFFLHAFALRILEHDKIFLPTHDRYIALFALTYGVLLILVSLNLERYKYLFYVMLIGIFLSFLNGLLISVQGGYAPLFPVAGLDKKLSILGYIFLIWFVTLIITWFLHNKENKIVS